MTEGAEGTGPGAEQSPEGSGGTPTQETQPDWKTKAEGLEAEVKQLRETRKEETAEQLAAAWPEDRRDAVKKLLLTGSKSLSVDDLKERASALKEVAGSLATTETPPPADAAEEPANKDQLAKVAAAGDQGAAPVPPDRSGDTDFLKELQGAKSLGEIEAIQNRLRQQARQG